MATRTHPASENGFSLLSTLAALAIVAIVATGIMMAIYQIYNVSSGRTNSILAIRAVQNAGRWVTLDAQRAKTITTYGAGFPLTMTWDDPANNQYEVVYSVSPDNELQRQHYTNKTVNPDPDATMLIASYIDPSNTSCSVNSNKELIATISANVSFDRHTSTETRTYRIYPRRNLR